MEDIIKFRKKLKIVVDDKGYSEYLQYNHTIHLKEGSVDTATQKRLVNRAYRDTVLHEFGHAVDNVFNAPGDSTQLGVNDPGYSEGFSDVLVMLYTGSPRYGIDLRRPNGCIRDASEASTWPEAKHKVSHVQGQVYSGFTWDLLEGLINTEGLTEKEAREIVHRLTFGVALRNPISIEDAIRKTFEEDEDDPSRANDTPHFRTILAAATKRGFDQNTIVPTTIRRLPEAVATKYRTRRSVTTLAEDDPDLAALRRALKVLQDPNNRLGITLQDFVHQFEKDFELTHGNSLFLPGCGKYSWSAP
jgi:hypothetical protein